jgi:hypothetical protein
MRRHTPPHCTKKEQQGGIHLLTVSKGKWKGWRGGEDNKLPLKSLRFVDVSNTKNTPRRARFSCSRVVDGMSRVREATNT